MAKETMIVFVYDTECLKDEADDPVNAVLYFHPSWVSDTQKVALCGQLMGTSHFLKDCFFKPRIIALQNGKFVLKEFGRFILAVGTDRNITDYLLQHRADLLGSLLRFYHRDLQTIFDQFALQAAYKNLAEKLYHIFETYLPILQHNGNIFQNVTKLRMPKTASNIFLDAIQTLQCCQQTRGVLGGAILYHNKVVATQLSDAVTKQLVITDPLHIRTTAEQITALDSDLHIPNGVQMLVVYVEALEYRKLAADAQRAQNLQTTQLSQSAMHFQYAKRKMKRDKSLIFTHIPEEGSATAHELDDDGAAVVAESATVSATAGDSAAAVGELQAVRPKSVLTRPTHLPLRLRNMTAKEPPESGIASINFDETDSYPEFIGRTSVCSTPMTENKVLPVANIMSICANPDDDANDDESNSNSSNRKQQQQQQQQRKSLLSYRGNSLKIDFEKVLQNYMAGPNKQLERRNSFADLQDSLKKISKKFSLKPFANGFKTDVNRNNGTGAAAGAGAGSGAGGIRTDRRNVPESPDFIENDGDEANDDDDNADMDVDVDMDEQQEQSSDNSDENNRTTRTITDPTYPMFNANGQPISSSLFQEFLEKYYKLWGDAADETNKDAEIAQLIEEFKEFDSELKKLDASLRQDANNPTASFKADRNLNIETVTAERQPPPQQPQSQSQSQQQQKPKTPLDKRSMSLPLKPRTDATPSGDQMPVAVSTAVMGRKQSGGIPLTPLMAKLSVLALNDERAGWDATPGAGIDIQTPLNTTKLFPRRSSLKCDDALDALATMPAAAAAAAASSVAGAPKDGLQRAELYVCGQQNMTLLLLMEEGTARQQQVVQKMFEICVAKFPHMETHLNQTLNVNVEGDKHDGGYSFICIDAKWDALQRNGPWNPTELHTLECMHRDLQCATEVTDLILRSHDSVFYGYNSGRRELFYKEPAHQVSGIPPPSDPMGNIGMRAKARLERDHSYILF